ncbi:hypothetical protein [Oleiharenicola lentus]|uniref:hypothetical protein n=1 Tax=Oleiharenicola lentus TaxID=2508720 RepID=UPI003F66267C
MNYITELQRVIRALHGTESRRTSTVHVTEKFDGKIVWDGKVEVFELLNHPKTKTAYAWAYLDKDNRQQSVAVLHMPPVESARHAVRAAIASRLLAASSPTAPRS